MRRVVGVSDVGYDTARHHIEAKAIDAEAERGDQRRCVAIAVRATQGQQLRVIPALVDVVWW